MQTVTAFDTPSEFERTTLRYLADHLEINLAEFCAEHFAKDFDSLTKVEAQQLYFRLRAIEKATKPTTRCLECGSDSLLKKCDLCREGISKSQLTDMVRRGSDHLMARGLKAVIEIPRRPVRANRFRLQKGNERP